MTATTAIGPVRRGRTATVQSYVRLTASTYNSLLHLRRCRADPEPSRTGAADITITNTPAAVR